MQIKSYTVEAVTFVTVESKITSFFTNDTSVIASDGNHVLWAHNNDGHLREWL